MPELPEVENVCIGLTRTLVGQKVQRVVVNRREVVRGGAGPGDLLNRQTIRRIDRLGKQFALVGEKPTSKQKDGRQACACIHLGMTGSLRYYAPEVDFQPDKHTHVAWTLAGGGRLAFRDPRRFGGIWTFRSVNTLHEARWSKLGKDALTITPSQLHPKLQATQRAVKSALLDQSVIAGLGNIYVDELLFVMGIHPLRPGCEVSWPEAQQLVRRMRTLLARSIRLGGSSLRDYVDSSGQPGGFQQRHRVYGRSGLPCRSCDQPLACMTISGRTTVCCQRCQT